MSMGFAPRARDGGSPSRGWGARVGALALTAGLLVVTGCAPVAAWDRETLAHRAMADDADPEASSFAAHVAGAREAALDPSAGGGGGCGCN